MRRPHTVRLDGYAASHRAVREFSEHPPGQDRSWLTNLNFAPEPFIKTSRVFGPADGSANGKLLISGFVRVVHDVTDNKH